jgi:ubiquinone/menaquinone biosynthesis C-methylase UbiE
MPTTKSIEGLRADFDRIAQLPDSGGWDHNRQYHDFLLRHLPIHIGAALDIGCGRGEFARLLAKRADHVSGIDLSPVMIELAKVQNGVYPNTTFEVGDVMTMHYPDEAFDCIASIATLHHMPLAPILGRAKRWLKPNGVLLILDLRSSEGAEMLLDALAFPVNMIYKQLKTAGKSLPRHNHDEIRTVWDAHGREETYLTMREVKAVCRDLLPDAKITRHFFWRYSIVYRKNE